MESNPSVADDLREAMAHTGFYGWMGVELVRAEPGEVELALQTQPHHLNLLGLLHGGVVATLADTAGGLAIRTKLEEGRRHVTIQLDVHYLAPVQAGRIVATGRAVRIGSRIGYAETDVVDGTGRLLAKAQATAAVTADASIGAWRTQPSELDAQ